MPKATPSIKVDAVRKLGVQPVLHGDNYDEAQAYAMKCVEEEGRTLIHPFDDPLVIAGQGTIGMEILKQTTGTPLHAIFVCCGGGGMLAGIAAYVKRVRPDVMVIGVEAEDAAGMTLSLRRGHRATLDEVGLFADGAAVKTVGSETFRVCHELVDDMVTVSTDEICAAIKDAFMDTRCVLEPAGALAIAGATKWAAATNTRDSTFVVTTSGANMNFDTLRYVSERTDASETLLSVEIPEKPGAFRKLISLLEPRNVTELSYRYRDSGQAIVYLSFQASCPLDKQKALQALGDDGCQAIDLTDNELAKAHARHLAGGRSSVENEFIYRFEFPERPGALVTFLDTLNAGWNVTMFHYRNHGSDVGRVLAGIQVPTEEKPLFDDFLQRLHYRYFAETDNPAVKHFFRP
uniref:Threonine dehydratase n=2 Tax=Chrysotila carterae TaxID=13221 RepID=A0A7S4ES75_CHRCT